MPATLRDELNAALFRIYTRATEGKPGDPEDFDSYEIEDIGVVLRAGDAALNAMAIELGHSTLLDVAADTPSHPERTE